MAEWDLCTNFHLSHASELWFAHKCIKEKKKQEQKSNSILQHRDLVSGRTNKIAKSASLSWSSALKIHESALCDVTDTKKLLQHGAFKKLGELVQYLFPQNFVWRVIWAGMVHTHTYTRTHTHTHPQALCYLLNLNGGWRRLTQLMWVFLFLWLCLRSGSCDCYFHIVKKKKKETLRHFQRGLKRQKRWLQFLFSPRTAFITARLLHTVICEWQNKRKAEIMKCQIIWRQGTAAVCF